MFHIIRNPRRRIRDRAAMSLVELLVVVSIIVILMAVSVPLMRPAIREASLRESSRLLNTYLTSARSRAIQNGSECGIQFVRADVGNPALTPPNSNLVNASLLNTCFEAYIVETPAPYAGDFADSRADLIDANDPSAIPPILPDGYANYAEFNTGLNAQLDSLVQRGDLIQFGNSGGLYVITGKQIVGTVIRLYFTTRDSTLSMPQEKTSQPYLLYRQPVRSHLKPLQLTGGTCIDLYWSGIGAMGTQFGASSVSDGSKITILFSPNGGISRVGYGAFQADASIIPSSSIYLLIGTANQVVPPPATPAFPFTGERENDDDPSSTWIAIAPRTGALTIAENDPEGAKVDVAGARTFVRTGQSMGGR